MTLAGLARQRENIAKVTASMTGDDYKAARAKAWRTLVTTGRAAEKVAQLHRDKSGRTPAEVEELVNEVRDQRLCVSDVVEKYGYSRSGAQKIVSRAKAG